MHLRGFGEPSKPPEPAKSTEIGWTGYLGDIGIPPVDAPMDFSAWFEVYLGHWQTFDARHNTPRIGRILMARGRDATDVALSTIFGPSALIGFNVVTEAIDQRT
jgi:transglutaminase-like putative cysteine protease